MAEKPTKPTEEQAPGLMRRAARAVKPSGGARQTIGVILLLTIVAVVVAALVLGVERSRANYFQQRNLRELDRVATNIGATSQTLGSVASLYFNPAQLQYSLTPGTECLMATTRIQRTADLAIDINYYFVDTENPTSAPSTGEAKGEEKPAAAAAPAGDKGKASGPAGFAPAPGKTNEPLRAPPAAAAPAATAGAASRCAFDSPIGGAGTKETMIVDGERIRLTEWLSLRDLLRPMVSVNGGAGADPAATARTVIEAQAADRIERGGFGPRPGTDIPEVVRRSVKTAFDRNAIRTEVIVSIKALDLGTSLETFDAVQILGTPESDDRPPPLLFQAGQLPPAISGGESGASRDFLKAITSAGGGQASEATNTSKNRSYQEAAGSGSLLMESKVYPAGDLMIFDKTYASLGGFDCSPARTCRIIGVIKDQRFGSSVRRFEGMHSTFFLIAVMTLVGLVPMIHLALRKRLDAVGRRAQYVMWFSLTLLAASAIIASLTVWAGAVSKSASASYAESEVKRIKNGFAKELEATLTLMSYMGNKLVPSPAVFPAPDEIHWKAGIPPFGHDSMLLDTTGYFRGDGYGAREYARFSDVRTPPFGTNISDRPYFNRARNGDFEELKLAGKVPCPGPDGHHRFVIDRVVARPDGVAKTIIMMPHRPGCGRAAPISDAEATGAGRPSQPQFLLASGYLQTFIAAATHPGFEYAVIDPGRREGEPDILFSSRRSAELSEEFEHDLDDRESFHTRLEEFRLAGDAERVRRLETHYRGDPVRLTMSRLHPSLDWVLVVIEGRNDAGFAIWRAATFGYSTWLVALILITLVMVATRLIRHKALDRRPGQWLWPVDVITDFSQPRFAYEPNRREEMGAAAVKRDRHLLLIVVAGAVGIFAAEAASRTLFAFGVVSAAFAARGYFAGRTSSDWPASRWLDRFFVRASIFFLLLSLFAYLLITAADDAGEAAEGQWVRTLIFLAALGVTTLPLGAAMEAAAESKGDETPSGGGIAAFALRLLRGLGRFLPAWLKDLKWGWIFFLLAIGSLPAAAGYLDSIDHDSALVAERKARIEARSNELRSRTLASIDIGRRTGAAAQAKELPLRDRIVAGGLPGEQLAAPRVATGTDAPAITQGDGTIAYLSLRALELHEMALSFSDFRPWHMRDGYSGLTWGTWFKFLLGLLAMLLPFLLLFAAFAFFRKQYFTAPPRSPAIDPADFSAPLSAAREDFVKQLLVPAATAGTPLVPFENDPSFRHVILGIDLDVKGDPDLKAVRDKIEWIDMLRIAGGSDKPPETIDPKKNAVVVGNLDIALQLPDAAKVKEAFEALATIVDKAKPGENKRHLFILSDIAPLDRIALMRERAGQEEGPSRIEDWRWANLLQDFTLIAVMPTTPFAGVTTGDENKPPAAAERELMVINTVFAKSLLAQLRAQGKLEGSDEYQDRVIDYVAEQMADYYHKLWAASSDEERVLLYHIAWRCHLKMTDGPALRSLLVRGLIVRSPEYRLMNKSFARYVRRVERLDKIRERAAGLGGLDNIWPVIRVPLLVFTLALLVIVQLISPRHATGALGIVPALGAIVPALLANWIRIKAAEG
ncbi:MAG TPA: hypothetical protein VIT45_14125 [Allosphingosinicella sp.]